MSIEVRLAAPEEHSAVDELVRRAYEFDYGPREEIAGGEDDPRFARVRAREFDIWVAVDPQTGALLGTITIRRAGGQSLMEDAVADELDFRLLGVSPDARRSGIGSLLTRLAADEARRGGYARVFLKSAPNMVRAHQLYEKLGYRRDPDRDGLIIGGRKVHDLIAFVLPVPALVEQ